MNKEAFAAAAQGLGLVLTADQLGALEIFEDKLYDANEVMNLTRVDREECWLRHFLDSLLFQDLIPEGSTVLDIGVGPGFPAWPLACARPDLQVVGIDSSGKMIGFLLRNPLSNLKALQVRAEDWEMRDSFDVVTGRAVAPLSAQLELSAPFCKIGGAVIPMRTPGDQAAIEMNASRLGIKVERIHQRILPGTDIVRLFPIYRKSEPTPARYPRSWSEIKHKPIF